MLAISLVLALLFGLAEMGEPLEDVLRVARNKASPVAASGDIVVVTIDDASQRAVGSWPWPRSTHGAMIKRLTDAGAAKIVVDVHFQYATDKQADRAFAAELKRSGRVVLPNNLRVGEGSGMIVDRRPDPLIANQVELGAVSFYYNFRREVWNVPYGLTHDGTVYRSLASIMAGIDGPADQSFPINYRIQLESIPQLSAQRVLQGE